MGNEIDEVDGSNIAEFFTRGDEKDEAKTVEWFQRMTGSEKPEAKPVYDETLETDSAPVVESEEEADEVPAPDSEGVPAEAGEPADEQSEQPEGDQSTDDLRSNLSALQRREELLSRQLAQAQWQLQQTALAQQADEPEPPRWHQMTPAQQEQLLQEAQQLGAEPSELLTERRAEWRARQVLAERDRQTHEALHEQRRAAFEQAAHRLIDFSASLEEHREHVLAEFDTFPELFEVARQMEPGAMERTLKRFMSGLAAEAKLKTLEAKTSAIADSARKAGREEAQNGKVNKVNATRTQAARTATVQPNLQSAPSKAPDTTSFIKQLAAGRASSTWE